MASYRKRGKTWTAEVRRKGISQYATFPTKAEAVEWASELERKIRQGQRPIDHRRTLGDLLERYAKEVSPRKGGAKWEQTRIAWLCQQPLTRTCLIDLTPAVLAAWREGRLTSVSGETVRRDMTLLSHALAVATKEWLWLGSNPMSQVSRPKGNPHRERIATQEEIDRLCYVAGYEVGRPAHTASQRVAACFVFCCETGVRGGEATKIAPPVVRSDHVVLLRTKNGTSRSVPLSASARQILEDVCGCFELTVRQKDAIFRKLREKAGIEGLNFNDSRHTAITRLAQKLNPLELARMVGHKNLSQLLVYYNESAEQIAKKLT